MNNAAHDSQMKLQIITEDIWLNYFNRYLLEKGAISQNDYAKMAEKITIRSARLSHKSANKSS